MATVEIDGIETQNELRGEGPPLLMYAPGGFDAQISKWSDLGVYKRIRLLDHLPGVAPLCAICSGLLLLGLGCSQGCVVGRCGRAARRGLFGFVLRAAAEPKCSGRERGYQ